MKTFQDGDPLFGVMMNAIANLWPNGTAVLSGCTQTGSGAARQVTMAAGTVVIGGTVRPVSQQTKTLDAATFDRYDLLSVNSSGTVVVTKGTEERRVPALPANSVPIAICLVETGQTTLPADRIYDSRMDALRLSVLNIDAHKDWGGKNITNVGTLQATTISGNLAANKFSVVASDTAIPTLSASKYDLYGSESTITHLLTCTMPAGLKAGSTFRCTVSTSREAGGIRVLVNGTEVYTSTSTKTYDCSVNPGDTLTIQYVGGLLSYGRTDLSAVVRGTLTTIVDLATQDWAVVL